MAPVNGFWYNTWSYLFRHNLQCQLRLMHKDQVSHFKSGIKYCLCVHACGVCVCVLCVRVCCVCVCCVCVCVRVVYACVRACGVCVCVCVCYCWYCLFVGELNLQYCTELQFHMHGHIISLSVDFCAIRLSKHFIL